MKGMSILNKLKSKSYFNKILYVFGIYLLFFIIVVIGLRMYTHHNKSYPVPDFKGLDLDRADQLARYNKLRYKIVDSTYMAFMPKGCVIDQHPIAGVNVKKNRTVFLTVNAYNMPKIEMPKIVGYSYRQGKAILESAGLKVGRLIYKPDFAENNILQQMYKGKVIKEGQMIEKGQGIDLVLGNGLGRSTSPVPNLEKLSYQRAVAEINDAFFNLGKVYYDNSVTNYTDSLSAVVFRQHPEYSARNRAVMGATIDIWLTTDKSVFEVVEDSTSTEVQ